MTVLASDETTSPPAPRWSTARLFTFRFACAYWIAFLVAYLPGFFDGSPATRWLGRPARFLLERLIPWVGTHLFGVAVPLGPSGSGDKMFDWVQAFCVVTIAVVGGTLWCVFDRKRREYEWLESWLRVVLRYSLAVPMLSYGMVKVIKLQFPSAPIDRLLEPYGRSSPMGLLWTFMGYSTGYNLFTGLVETLGGLFLLMRRTTPLGALLVVIGMTNVVVLNFTFDVPVKLYSLHLLLMGIFLLLPDAKRLLSVLVFNRPTDAAAERQAPATSRGRRVMFAVKAAAVALVLYLGISRPIAFRLTNGGDFAGPPALYGLYEVTKHTRAGVPVPPMFNDPTRWRRVAFNRSGVVSVYFADDTMQRFRAKDDAASHTLELPYGTRPDQKHVLQYERTADGTLMVHGTFAYTPIEATLRPVPLDSFLLVSRGFNWIQELPFNR